METVKRLKKVGITTHLFFICLLFTCHQLPAQNPSLYKTDPNLLKAYELVLQLRLEEGRSILKSTSPQTSSLTLQLYVANLADILELLITEDKALYQQYVPLEKERMKILQSLPDPNPYKKYAEAEIRLQWAFVKLKFGDELSAVWNFRQAYTTIKEQHETFPKFLPNLKTLGILHVIFGAVPEKYQWVLSILGLEGNLTTGQSYLSKVAASENIFSLESKILSGLVKMYLLDDEKAVNEIRQISQSHPDNLLFRYLLTLTLIKKGKSEEAAEELTTMAAFSDKYLRLSMNHYLTGEINLQKGAYEEAIKSYRAFLSSYEGENFIKDAHYKIFLAYLLQGNEEMTARYFILARENGSTGAEADKYAARQLLNRGYPNPVLMKIRLATDGGYYEKAEGILNQVSSQDFSKDQDRIEYVYRKARILDKQQKTEEAIPYYLRSIEMSEPNSQYYFAPNAALQLGYIYQLKGELKTAREYFQKVLKYQGHEYKNSLDHKAEAALEKLEKMD